MSYDYGAAGNWTGDVNPWTLVNVFDMDPDTNVVCEGYAEAYEYLCDLSDFDGDVECYSVSGADHKWNIVRINGKSYLTDLTNGDKGSTADRKNTFLNGGKGSVEKGYTIGGFHYWYYEEVKSFWGTGADSILKLEDKKYDPEKDAANEVISQKRFEAALKKCGGTYALDKDRTLTTDLTVEGVRITVSAGHEIIVAAGAQL